MKKILFLLLTICSLSSFGQKFLENSPPQSPTVERINQAISGAFVTSGTNTYSITFVNGSYSYTALTGLALSYTFTNPNTTSSSLNFDGLGAKNIKKWSSGFLIDVDAGDLIGTVRLRYDGIQFVMEGVTGSGGGLGTVTDVSIVTANGVSGSVATSTTTPAITLTLGAITPTSVAASGTVTGSNLSGTNTGDQTTISGNAGTATALATPRTIGTVTGDATSAGSSFDGSANNTNALTVTKINGTSLSGLATGILKNTTSTGVPSIAVAGTDYQSPLGFTPENVANKATALTTMNSTLYPTTASLFDERAITAADAIVQSDNGKMLYFNSATPFNFTIDILTIKSKIAMTNIGAGTVTFTVGTVSSISGPTTLPAGGSATIFYHSATAPLIRTDVDSDVESVTGTTNRITVTGTLNPVVDIAATYIGQNSITTLGTIGTGTWNGTAIGPTFGGTGQTTLSTGDLLQGTASNTWGKLPSVATGNALISGGVTTASSWGKIGLTTHVSGLLPYANFSDGAALSVVGRSANSSGVQADITAGSDGNVLRRSGTSIGFGSGDLSSTGFVGSSILPIANGGTGVSTGAWLLASGGTVSGTNTITSNARNQLNFGGAWTATTDLDYHFKLNNVTTMSSTTGQIVSDFYVNGQTIAGANSQQMVGIFVNKTFTPGAFTSTVSNSILARGGDIRLQNSSAVQAFNLGVNGLLTIGSQVNTYIGPQSISAAIDLTNGVGMRLANSGYTTSTSNITAYNYEFRPIAASTANSTSGNATYIYAPFNFAASSATTTFRILDLSGTWNTTSTYAGTGYVIDYNPILTGTTGLTVIGTRFVSGNHLWGGSTITASTRFDLRGTGTTSSTITQRWADSGNTLLGTITDDGTLKINHIGGNTSAPTIAAGAGAGTTPTVVITNATDISGIVDVTTGTIPTGANAVIATITFNKTFATAPNIQLTPNNANAAGLAAALTMVYVTSTTTTFIITSGTTALTAATQYKWFYSVIQ